MEIDKLTKVNPSDSSLIVDGIADAKIFKEECQALRSAINLMWQQKKSKEKIKNSTFGKHLIRLKALNRNTQFRQKSLRDATFKKKLLVDQQNRKLQNLLYELAHLEDSIQTCLEFKSLHDEIDLIPKEEYHAEVSTAHDSTISPHKETLNRLYWELEKRKELHASLNDLSNSVELMSKTITDKKTYLCDIGQKLKEVSEFARPLDVEMNLCVGDREDNYQTAFLLPAPLYILYSQLGAFVDVKGLREAVTVQIEGDLELARSVNTCEFPPNEDIEAESSDVEDPDHQSSKRKKGRHKSKNAAAFGVQLVSKQEVAHPLTISVKILPKLHTDGPKLQLHLTFSWLSKIGLVSVRTEVLLPDASTSLSQTGGDLLASDNLLAGLLFFVSEPSDNPGQVLLLHKQAADTVDASLLNDTQTATMSGYTYLWAQQLAGLRCLPNIAALSSKCGDTGDEKPTECLPFGFIETWFSAVNRRIESRLSLNAEFCSIENGILNLSENQKPFFSRIEEVGLTTWERIIFDELKAWPRAETFIALDLIQPSDAIFKCQMSYRGHDALTIGVSIPASYPDEQSLIIIGNSVSTFSACDLTSIHMQELETEINCFCKELPIEDPNEALNDNCDEMVDRHPANLLSCQLARLASCLPVFLTPLSDPNHDAGKSTLSNVRYRTRSRPLKFLPNLGAFTYR